MKKGIIKRYFRLLGKVPLFLVIYSVFVIIGELASLGIPVFSSLIIDQITLGNMNGTYQAVILLGILYLIHNASNYLNSYFYVTFFKNCYVELHRKLIDAIYQYDMMKQKDLPKAKIINTSNLDLISVCEIPSHLFHTMMEFVKLLLIIFIFMNQSIILGILVTILHLLYLKQLAYLNKEGAKHFKNQRMYADKLTGLLAQILNGLKDIKMLNLIEPLNQKLEKERKNWKTHYFLRRKCIMRKESIAVLIVQIGKLGLYGFLIQAVFNKSITIGTLLFLISYYEKMTTSVTSIMEYSMSLLDEEISFERIESILKMNFGRKAEKESDISLEYPDIYFKNVSFSYHKKSILKNATIDIPFGEITVLTGTNGVGKTTVFNLIVREITPQKGNIYLSGQKIETYSLDNYLDEIAIVTQEPFLFNMSIQENFSMINKNRKVQIYICKRIGLHDMIMNLPNGYYTTLKEFAMNLSGGQKQLFALGRALMKKSKVLLLDEFTSSLDKETIEKMISILQEMKRKYLILIISHDERIQRIADNVLILEKGKIKKIKNQ